MVPAALPCAYKPSLSGNRRWLKCFRSEILPLASCRSPSATCPEIRARARAGLNGTLSVCGAPLEGRQSPGFASARVTAPELVPAMVTAWCAGCGRGPRANLPVAAERPARYPRVRPEVLQAPIRIGADADNVVAVPDRIPGELNPNRGVGYQNYPNSSSAAGNVRRSAEPVLAVQRSH